MVGYLIQIVSGIGLIIIANAKAHIFELSKSPLKKQNTFKKILLLFLFLVFACLLLYKVEEIPVAYNVDEAGMAYDALSLLNYGVDRYLYHNPVYFINFGGGQNALYTYLAMLSIKAFGYSILSVRLPAVLLSLIAAVCFTLIIQNEYGYDASVISMALFCILPFSIMHSRWALESYLLFPMTIISVCCFYFAIATGKKSLFFLTGVLLGITLYSYAISYIFIPLFLGSVLIYLMLLKKIRLTHIIFLGIPLFFLAIPLLLMVAVNNGLIDEIRTPFLSVPKMLENRYNDIGFQYFFSHFQFNKNNIIYKILFNDQLPYNSIPKFGTLYYISLPIIIYGFVISLKAGIRSFYEKSFSFAFMIVLIFFSALLTSLMVYTINVNRACEIYFPLIFFLCIGLVIIYRNSKPVFILTGCVYCFLFGTFIHYYFTDFSQASMKNFGISSITDLNEALIFAESLEREDKSIYVTGKSEPYISTLLATGTDPYTFAATKTLEGLYVSGFEHYHFMRYLWWQGIPHDYIYIFRDPDDIPWTMDLTGLERRQFGTVAVYYDANGLDRSEQSVY